MSNVTLNENFRVERLTINDNGIHLEIRLLNGRVALTSTLVSLDVSHRPDDNTYSGYLFVEPTGIPGHEPLNDEGDFRVPVGTIPNDDEHNGLLYRFHEFRDTWGDPEPNPDYTRFQYVNYEGAEDSLAGFFDYDDTDYLNAFSAIAAQVKVLNDRFPA